MPLNKKVILIIFFLLVSTSMLSGCILEDLIFGTSFDLKNKDIDDFEGFPVLNFSFSASNEVTLKMYNKENEIVDTDYFYSDSNTTLNIGDYMENIDSGVYRLKVTDDEDNQIYDEEFNFKGPVVSILSCNQRWWKNDDAYHLIGLELTVSNTGDAPFYPHSLKLSSGSEMINSLILPDYILPGYTKTIYCYLYHKDKFDADSFTLDLLDEDNNIQAFGSFIFDVEKNVNTRKFDISALDDTLYIPYVDFLYKYYVGLDRTYLEDYSLFVFDKYDELFIDLILEQIIYTYDFGEYRFNMKSDSQRVEYIASFVQGLDYRKDSEIDDSYEYPKYPAETVFSRGGDCEDKAILTASLLNNMGYETALLRLPNHMAVGVKLNQDLPGEDYYFDDYYFLETTTPGHSCGEISEDEYRNLENLTIYYIEDRALLVHNWKDNVITTYKNTQDGNVVKAVAYTSNLGNKTAEDVVVEGLFFIEGTDTEFSNEQIIIQELKSGDKKKTVISCSIPDSVKTKFKTRIYLDGNVVDNESSKDYFS